MVQSIIPLMPQKVRISLYIVYALAGSVIGAIQVGIAAAEVGQPTWLTVTLAVYAFLGTAFGYTATTQTGREIELVEALPSEIEREGKSFLESPAREELERLIEKNREEEN